MSTYLKTVGVVAIVSIGTYLTAKLAAASSVMTANVEPARAPPPRPLPSAVMFPSDEEAWTGVIVGQSIDLMARIETKVKSITYRVGDPVRTNDVVAELDTVSYEHEIAAAEAAVRQARAETANAGVYVSQARERERRRSRVLNYGGTEIALASKEEISDTKFDGLSASTRASAANAMADERVARLAQLREVVRTATLRAPFDGTVATVYTTPGALVNPGNPVVRIVGNGGLRVRFAVPESESSSVKLRSRVTLEWDDRRLEGTVDRIAPEVESLSSSVVMEAVVDGGRESEHKGLAGRVVGVRLARPKPRH